MARSRTPVRRPAPTSNVVVRDGLVNLTNSLGTSKDPRSATAYSMIPLTSEQLFTAYRSNWLARVIVDAIAEDATREWRDWHAEDDQIEAIEDEEKKHGIQGKITQALIRSRLLGGAGLLMGIDGTGKVGEPLDLERVAPESLKFVIVLSSNEMTRGQRIADVMSEWYGRPEYYRINTGTADLEGTIGGYTDIHPSRVVEFVGADIPDWNLTNSSTQWGDSVLQIVDDVLKDYGITFASAAAMVNDGKVDVFTIPGLTKMLSDPAAESRLRTRLTAVNVMKSTINAILMDKDEEWQRTQTNFSGLPPLLAEFLRVVAGAAGIPLSRIVGQSHGAGSSSLGGNSGGDSDLRNYYDQVSRRQKNEYSPRLAPLDEVIKRSAGIDDPKVYYEWAPLYQATPEQLADIAVKKSTVFSSDVATGLINPDVLREARLNQLVEDGFYPGLEAAIEEFGAEPEEITPTPDDITAHLGMLQKSSKQLTQIGQQAQPMLPAPKKTPTQDADGASLAELGMFRRR